MARCSGIGGMCEEIFLLVYIQFILVQYPHAPDCDSNLVQYFTLLRRDSSIHLVVDEFSLVSSIDPSRHISANIYVF